MKIEILPAEAQDLLTQHSTPRQDLVISYWQQVLTRPIQEVSGELGGALEHLTSHGISYRTVFGADQEPDYQPWLTQQVPQAAFDVWPGSGHFPHLAHPDRFAELFAVSAG